MNWDTPCPGCEAAMASYWERATGSCARCWPRLPGDLRTRILRAWGRRQHGEPGAAGEHLAALQAAAGWFERYPR